MMIDAHDMPCGHDEDCSLARQSRIIFTCIAIAALIIGAGLLAMCGGAA